MRCIAIINQKGGCGKTTVAINLAACLAGQSRRTLLVDMDPQSHCSVGLAVPEEQIERTIYDVLISAHSEAKTQIKSIAWQISENFDLAPAGIELAALEVQLAGQDRREECLRQVLAGEPQSYEYVVVDCPPSVGLLTFNALRAADMVIIPVETGYFALYGLGKELETLEVLRDQCEQQISFKVLASMYDVRTKLAREVLSELKIHYGKDMFKTIVNFNTKLKEAASFGQPISEYDTASRGMRDFQSLAREVIEETEAVANAGAAAVETVEHQLEAISKSADDLLKESQELVGSKARASEPSEQSLQSKIDDFYGVRQGQGKVEFVALYPRAQKVQLAGDFNGWRPEETPLKSTEMGRWHVAIPLERGVYHYRYVVDGRWQQDPYNEQCQPNPFGEYNSVVMVK